MNDKKMIKVWAFKDAPQEYRKLSENGGDEDWVLVMDRDEWLIKDGNNQFVAAELQGLINSFYHDYLEKIYTGPNNELVLILCHT